MVSPREDTFSKGNSDKGTRAESITANTETGISTSNSHGDKKGRKSGETKKKSGGKKKADRPSLTITSSGGGGEDIVRFRERRKLSEELLEVEQSDNKTKDVDIGGYGMKRDKRVGESESSCIYFLILFSTQLIKIVLEPKNLRLTFTDRKATGNYF